MFKTECNGVIYQQMPLIIFSWCTTTGNLFFPRMLSLSQEVFTKIKHCWELKEFTPEILPWRLVKEFCSRNRHFTNKEFSEFYRNFYHPLITIIIHSSRLSSYHKVKEMRRKEIQCRKSFIKLIGKKERHSIIWVYLQYGKCEAKLSY